MRRYLLYCCFLFIFFLAYCGTGIRPISSAVDLSLEGPGDFAASPISATEINLSWTDVSGELSYHIESSDDGQTWSELASLVPNSISYSHTGLTDGTLKFYRARYHTYSGYSKYAGPVSATTTSQRVVTYSGTTFPEATANDGSITQTRTVTIANDTFVSTLSLGTHYSISAGTIPSGLTLVVTRSSATQLTLSLTGNATSHADANDASFTLLFLAAAFTSGNSPQSGASQGFTVDFNDSIATSKGPKSPVTLANDASSGSGSWSFVTNAAANDGSYAVVTGANDPTNYLKATDFFSSDTVPTGATINGIKVEIDYKSKVEGGSCAQERAVRLVKGGSIGSTNKSTGAAFPETDTNTYVSFGGSSDLWGETWTASDINASNFGVVFAARAGSAQCPANVDHIQITVYYTPP